MHEGSTTAFLGLLKPSKQYLQSHRRKALFFAQSNEAQTHCEPRSALSQNSTSFPGITKCLHSSCGAGTGLLVCECRNS